MAVNGMTDIPGSALSAGFSQGRGLGAKFLFALGVGMPGLSGFVKALMRRENLMKESCDHIDQAVPNPSYAI
jgi:hypothetical protein